METSLLWIIILSDVLSGPWGPVSQFNATAIGPIEWTKPNQQIVLSSIENLKAQNQGRALVRLGVPTAKNPIEAAEMSAAILALNLQYHDKWPPHAKTPVFDCEINDVTENWPVGAHPGNSRPPIFTSMSSMNCFAHDAHAFGR